jgi:NAD(P)-dependent dehydrogenase (short-subunit alcohol dehydrogenase family)
LKDLFDLTGKTAIVTGSSKGIGRSIAEQLAYHGANVVISSRKEGPCAEVADTIKKAGYKATAIPCHVGRKEDVVALVAETRKQFGPIDILVCNAASNPYYGPLADAPDDAYHKTIDTNVQASIWLVHEVLPDMKAKKDGAIILVSSVGSLKSSNNLGLYAVSKAATNQLARSLAGELGPLNIRVNAILPGLIKTDFARALWEDPERAGRVTNSFPLRRIGDPDDIGPSAVFLASAAGKYMTGQMLVIDGGGTIAG